MHHVKHVLEVAVMRMHTNVINGEHTKFLSEIRNQIHTIIILSDEISKLCREYSIKIGAIIDYG